MKRDIDTRSALDDILIEWHRYCDGYRPMADLGSSPMFRSYRTSKQYEETADIADGALHKDRCEAVSFHLGEMTSIQQTAIQINARNLSTGRAVWTSARLPTNLDERAILLAEARNDLSRRLSAAGVI